LRVILSSKMLSVMQVRTRIKSLLSEYQFTVTCLDSLNDFKEPTLLLLKQLEQLVIPLCNQKPFAKPPQILIEADPCPIDKTPIQIRFSPEFEQAGQINACIYKRKPLFSPKPYLQQPLQKQQIPTQTSYSNYLTKIHYSEEQSHFNFEFKNQE
jgi:hypothetical protein